ncbi:MAG TPA: hypothetical protein VNL69_05330 [Bacteroidota bacterium]|nr:hypothetical protein [Bacteroidota bacterium]
MNPFKRLCLALIVLTQFALAQIPRTISYQGVVTDTLGNPKPDGTYSFTFRLYAGASGGSALWSETKTLQVKRGLFSTLLGDQVVFGSSLTFASPYWLSVQVASEPELSPRIPLSTVAYSIRASRADTASYALVAPLQTVVDSARIAGTVATNAVTSQKILDSTITGADVSPNAQLNIRSVQTNTPISNHSYYHTNGTIGLATYLNSTYNSGMIGTYTDHPFQIYTSNSGPVITFSTGGAGGNVGIGTTAPTQKLDVSGRITVAPSGTTPINGYNGNVVITKPLASGQYINLVPSGSIPWSIGTVYGSPTFAIGVGQTNDASFTSPALAIQSGGDVGINTIAPGARIDVVSTSTTTPTGRFRKGTSTPTFTYAAMQVENFTNFGEAAWLRTSSSSNTYAVLNLTRHPSSIGNFMEGYNWDGVASGVRRFHINSSGTFVAGSDFAEAFEAVGGKDGFEPGDVVVLSDEGTQAVEKASRPYDTRVVGVYSTRPGVLGADKNGETRIDEHDIPVAITGIVPTKVCTDNGAIRAGDLLTTSSRSGYAMKATPQTINGVEVYPTGTIIGKALEALSGNEGVIKVLVVMR